MQNLYQNVISTSGKPVQGASVLVTNASDNSTATIYSDNGVTTTPNPLTTDAFGRFNFYAANGRYNFSVSANGVLAYSFTDVIVADVYSNKTSFTVTNPVGIWTSNVNAYNQLALQNLSSGTSASADLILYPDNGTDANGWVDVGVNSSGYADATYTCIGPNETYVLGSSVTGTGNLVFATGNVGTSKSIQMYTGGFTQAKTAYKFNLDSSGNIITKPQTAVPSLTVNGDMVMNLTSNTNLRISVRGSDGVTRVTNLTLA